MAIGRAPAFLGDALDGDWIAVKRQSLTVQDGHPVITDTEILGQISDARRIDAVPRPHIEATLTDYTGIAHQIISAPNLHIDFIAVLGATQGMDERQRLPESFRPEVTYEQNTGVDGQPDLWSYFLGPDGYLWWTSEAAGVTQNLESWNRHHWGENWRTKDPVFGPDDIDAEQDDDIEPHEAELENQNSAATSDLQIATRLAEAIRAARRHRTAS